MKTSLYLRLGTLVIGWLWGLTTVAQEAHLSQLHETEDIMKWKEPFLSHYSKGVTNMK